ncbi:MAG: ROK family protein [Chloroflexi bacterium]|nr:ROK family protein [Chloroflexota bacterium]
MASDGPEPVGSRGTGVLPSRSAAAGGTEPLGAVLDEVRLGDGGSRAEIVRHTGLSRGVVAQRLSDLAGAGLILDTEFAKSTGGRPARRIHFNAEAGTLLVADVGATSIDVAITDLAGTILASRAEDADVAEGPEAVLERVQDLFDEVLAGASGADGAPPWGIGIGVPGPVEFATGRPVSPPIMPGWNGHPVRDKFVERYGAPVWVDNDVNIMALGEWRAGVARFHDNVVFIKIGTGIGAGVISDGYLHRGARGSAGDVGHIQVTDDRSVVCRCGNIGCLEALAGGHALAREAQAAAADGRSAYLAQLLAAGSRLTARDLAAGATRGDPVCQELLQRSGHLVGAMLAGVVNFFNPSLIVIGGGVASAGDQLLAAVREAVYRRSLPLATRDLLILPSALGGRTGVIGAAAMVADELFSPMHLDTTMSRSGMTDRGGRENTVRVGSPERENNVAQPVGGTA